MRRPSRAKTSLVIIFGAFLVLSINWLIILVRSNLATNNRGESKGGVVPPLLRSTERRNIFLDLDEVESIETPKEDNVKRLRNEAQGDMEKSIIIHTQPIESKTSTYVAPEHLSEAKPKEAGKVHIFFYSWWGTPSGPIEKTYAHWNHAVLPHWSKQVNEGMKELIGKVYSPPEEIGANFYPQGGPYSSSDPVVIERHAREMRKAGTNVVILSWYPPGKADSNGVPELADLITPQLLDAFHEQGLQLAFHIEPYAGRSAQSVWDDAEYITLRYGKHPALARIKGLPILYVYDSYLISQLDWANMMEKYASRPKNAVYLGLVVEENHLKQIAETHFFDGYFTYFAAEGFVWGSTMKNWQKITSFARDHHMLSSISVGPGYEDTRIRPWNNVNSRPRKGGSTYRNAIQAAAEANPDFISITSFNEWHEGTQIEPAVTKQGYMDYGEDDPDMYLTLTKQLTSEYFPQPSE